jgi:hypothetical protein
MRRLIAAALVVGIALLSLLFLASSESSAFSETLRADYRGAGRVSAYRIMGLIGVLYAVGLSLFIAPELTAHVGLATALGSLWRPELILFLQAVWVAIFIYTGRSTVTGATIRLHLHTDRI